MANIRLIKGRIKSAKNISQITKAMELVAASKMRKAQAAALAGKLYANKIAEMVFTLSARTDAVNHPLLAKPKQIVGKRLVILISTNKGLCGGLNTSLFRFLAHEYGLSSKNDFVTIGRKGADFLSSAANTLVADFSGTVPFSDSVAAVTALATKAFLEGMCDGVDVVFSEFLSVLKQQPKKRGILPLTLTEGSMPEEKPMGEFLIEPSIAEVFDSLLPHYLENQIRDAILQAEASEHSARMVAMRNATDNALSLVDGLTLVYNKARQEKITYEISDIVTARLAAEG